MAALSQFLTSVCDPEKAMTSHILALIPARGGSKRIPGKNIRPLGGRPLIVWSIEAAKGTPEIRDILVSTDDPAIAATSRDAGALVPWLRPAELAADSASSIDVCLHALDWYERENGAVDGLLLLQPTSPFRSRATVQRGIELFHARHRRPVIGISPAKSHPMWCFYVEGESMRPFIKGANAPLRSQDLPPAYVVNGAFYLIAPADLRRLRSFEGPETVPLIVDEPEEGLDLDTEWEWAVAEAIVRSRRSES